MGTGIWAMHFVGMLAFQLPIPIAYDWSTTCLSMLIAIVVSAVALFVLRRPEVASRSLIIGALLMGIGISAMHYTGMIAMRMSPPIRYDPPLFISSILIAILASLAALWIALQLRGKLPRFAILARLASAGVMGLAIAGMHYTGMAAARFAPGSMCLAAASGGLENTTLAIVIGCIAMAIMSLVLILSTIDTHFAVRNARLAHSLQVAKDAADVALRANEKITAELRATQSELVTAARQAGIAEIANSVLHNIGNVLNSVNVSADLLQTRIREFKVEGLVQAVQLMQEHSADLGYFLSLDEKGRRLPGYLSKLGDTLAAEKRGMLDEIEALLRSIDHVKEIVVTQQSPENLTQLFVHGFTTRKGGHGFGLHSSALAAQTMGGSLTAHSDGSDTGAAFTL